MLVEILFLALVFVIALLIIVDVLRTPTDSPHGQADLHAYPVDRALVGAPRDAGARASSPEPAGTGISAAAYDGGRPGRLDGTGSSAGGHRRPGTWSPQHTGTRRTLKTWPVRLRLCLLVIVAAAAAAVVTLSAVRIAASLRGASIHSQVSSIRVGAIVSALVAGAVLIVVLVLALAFTIVLTRSVLRPLRGLRARALEVANVRLPDAVRRIGENGGEGVPLDVDPIELDSSAEIGDIAHAFDQVYGEVLRLAASDAALRGNLDTIFVNVSRRSQALVERQIRLIDDLEQGEQQAERRANLFKLDHLVTRMRRYSQNLLVLAGHELSGQSSQSVGLVNVIRAAVSEIEEYERVSLNVQPGIVVSGPAVNDVVHLLAELAENATSLSAADTPVVISGRRLASGGILVDITDRGFGMSAEEMAHANWRLDNPPAADITVVKSMGLFVVGRLAARHGMRIRLRPAESGGLTALVWLPNAIILPQEAVASPTFSGFGGVRSRPDSPELARPGRFGQLDPDRATAE